jgi:maleate isomerase
MTGHNNIISPDEKRRERENREYGRNGLFGILTPRENPTVEPELAILLPQGSVTLTARLTSAKPSLRERLVDYVITLPATIDRFGAVACDAIGFACTGSSYLIDPLEERRILAGIEDARQQEIVTAARAVAEACAHLAVRRIALISPYPDWLTAASRAHWDSKGLTVTAVLQLPSSGGDRHGIYALTTPDVLQFAEGFQTGGADAVLLTGTGMPSLRAILALEHDLKVPVLSSNLCLAWSLANRIGPTAGGSESALYGGWGARIR